LRRVDDGWVTVPSIKGSIFSRATEDISKLVSGGKLSQAELHRMLPEGDLKFLAQPISATSWYDVQVYGRLLDLLRKIEGHGDNEYLRRRGARSAEMLIQAGIHQQMEYLKRTEVSRHTDEQARFLAFGRDLRLLTSMHASILNFSKQTAKVDPDRPGYYVIEMTEAAATPEPLCWTTDGFMNRMAAGHGHGDLWRWERPSPDRIVYRMTRKP
jgi:hypothetical protein